MRVKKIDDDDDDDDDDLSQKADNVILFIETVSPVNFINFHLDKCLLVVDSNIKDAF